MKKILAVVAAILAAVALIFVGLTAPAIASGTTITKYGDVFTYNGANSWTIQNTDDDQDIKDIGNTFNGELCSDSDTGKDIPCVNGASYTFLGDTSVTGYDCAYVQIDGGNAGSQDTVPGDNSKSVCVPTTTSATAAAAITTTAASCSSAETVAEGTITNATWTTDSVSGGSYTLVATASSGYSFPTGTGVSADGSTDTFTGSLNAELTAGCTTEPTCVSSPTVTYTYSHDQNNTGVITVTEAGIPSGTALCTPFWVTATSWNYTNDASIWPQDINIVQKLEITTTGTTNYAAAVGCGQGDIYASYNSSAPSLNPANYPVDTGTLQNPNSPFTEHFLSDMGFTQVNSAGVADGGSPTYYNAENSCFHPTTESGTPIPTEASCQAPTGNGLSLPAVLGGEWTVSNPGYSKTYPADTAETITTVPNGYAAYTVTLTDASNTDGYAVTEQSWPWAPIDYSTLDCNTQIPTVTTPTFADAVSCSDGSITIPTTAGVIYSIGGTPESAGTYYNLTGSQTVTAAPTTGYEFQSGAYPDGGWTEDLGSTSSCVITYQLSDTCTYDNDNGTSNQDVSLVFDNTSGTSSTTFEVAGTTYTVDAGKTLTEDMGSVTSDGTTFEVYVGGSTTPTPVVVAPFTTCIPTVAGDPSVIQQTCDAVTGTANVDGQISVALNPELIYTITGPTGVISPVTAPLTNLPAGDYVVSVAAIPGYTVAGPIAWPLKLTVDPTACTIAPSDDLAMCTSDPETRTEIDGDITITLNPYIDYSVSGTGITGSELLSSATTSFPDGSYSVSAALSALGVTDGYQLVGDTSWGPYSFAALCVPVLPAWHANATGTDATCSSTGSTEGYITLEHLASETGDVKYSIENDATHKVQSVGATASKVKEAPGSYTVTASPVNPKDGISTDTVFDVTIAAAAAGLCDGTLAFTGGGFVGYLGVTLALGMLFLGIAAIWMRRRIGVRKDA